jgi:hypothetical protein
MREIRTSGLTSGDRKRSHVSPDCGGGAKASPTTHREATATAPVLDSTHLHATVLEEPLETVAVVQGIADRLRRRTAAWYACQLLLEPGEQVCHQRLASGLPGCQA